MSSAPDKMVCGECGADIPKPSETTKCEQCGTTTLITLEHFGYTVVKIGGEYLVKTLEGENVDILRTSQAGRDELADQIKVSSAIVKKAYMKAIEDAKINANNNTKTVDTEKLELYLEEYGTKAPDQGVHNDSAYLGFTVPVKVTDQETNLCYVKQKHIIFFENGDFYDSGSPALIQMGLHLSHKPINTDLRVTIDMIHNFKKLKPVDKDELLLRLINILKKYIEFDNEKYYTLCAIWVIGTYFYKRFNAYPYLFLNAVKRSGKTKLLTLLTLLSYNAILTSNISTSSIFRLRQNNGNVFGMDETEDMNDPEKKADIRSILLAGYKRGPKVYRSEKDEEGRQTPTPFETYGPFALACIAGIEDILEDRTLPIILKRGLNPDIMNRELPLNIPEWPDIRSELSRFYLQEWRTVDELYVTTEPSSVASVVSVASVGIWGQVAPRRTLLLGRDWELWKPLLAIGRMYLPDEPTLKTATLAALPTLPTLPYLYNLALQITEDKNADTKTDAGESVLLMGLLDLVTSETPKYYSIPAIRTSSSRYNENLPDWFNSTWIGRALKRLGFTDKRRKSGGVEYLLNSKSVLNMATRLSIVLPEEDPPEPEKEGDPDPPVFDGYEMEKLYNVVKDNPGLTKDQIITKGFKAGLSDEDSNREFRKLTGGYITHNAGKWRVK